MSKQSYAGELAILEVGTAATSTMSGCEKYGMTWGCDIDCPTLRAGNCELKYDVNKELWAEAQADNQ
jgi:hypothetical protein